MQYKRSSQLSTVSTRAVVGDLKAMNTNAQCEHTQCEHATHPKGTLQPTPS
ncbi:MAG: hypothetical protein F6J93_34155 [Oscillatoria sp. SIO1A7]|nr:hypothetical protein [Oscillatoria sp. SIO1A7]